ncbi:hypothetical protein AB0K00_54890 [Dactylosporangium sp. NPDC049525]|uniref:hypothetical protein n=1 Tax=Dactylosporangium sp. NPDC049525 TaxID=3154730 RepID=UPI003437B5D2
MTVRSRDYAAPGPREHHSRQERAIDESGTITLWRSTGQAELDRVAASAWREWPPRRPDQPTFSAVLHREHATTIVRERHVPAGGVGYVTRFEVQRAYLGRYELQHVAGLDAPQYRIPAGDLADLNAHIVGAIMEEADYRGPVDDQEFTDAHDALGRALPAAWRTYLRGASWFRRGWLPNGAYVWLNTPREMLGLHDAWDESTVAHPGIAIIGNDGSREQIVLDLRRDPAPVLMVDITSADGGHHQHRVGDRDPPRRRRCRADRQHRGGHLRVRLRRRVTAGEMGQRVSTQTLTIVWYAQLV